MALLEVDIVVLFETLVISVMINYGEEMLCYLVREA